MVDERTFTSSLSRFFGSGRGVRVPIGDDAAVVRCRGDAVLTCDPVVEGVQFLPDAPLGRPARAGAPGRGITSAHWYAHP